MSRRASWLAAALAALPACSVSSRFLQPRAEWIATPAALDLAHEDVWLPAGDDITLHGWFVPSAVSGGRTVLLCHGNAANVSFYHPYYRFLHEAGWNVFLFDYRGFGRSSGAPDVHTLTVDAARALDHVLARPDVDRDRVAVFGISLGAIVAMQLAATRGEPCGFVVENVSSPHRALQRELGGLLTWWLETFVLPGDLEPVANAAACRRPALFLCGAWDPMVSDHVAAAAACAGPTSSWLMPETGHAPAGLLQHDGAYQAAITRFLAGCANGRFPRVHATIVTADATTVTVDVRADDLHTTPVPCEVGVVGADGNVTVHRRLLHERTARWQLPTATTPTNVAAFPYAGSITARADTWEPVASPLTAAAKLLSLWHALAAHAASDPRTFVLAGNFVNAIADFEREHGPLPALAAAELVPSWLLVGKALLRDPAGDARAAAMARTCLQRCVDARPANPALHYWPDSRYVVGFHHDDSISEAKALLATLPH